MTSTRAPVALVSLALVGFAANSLLCRVALRAPAAIDPLTFTSVRLVSGAMALAVLARVSGRRAGQRGNWGSAVALFAYAAAFSVAYVRITAGIGALLLFGAVQLTMFVAGLRAGERLGRLQWVGFVLAVAGLVILSWRGVTAPDPFAAILMVSAGAAWGVYSLRGRGSTEPLAETAGNLARTVPLAIVASLIGLHGMHYSTPGLLLAIASGVFATGVGYCLWYAALPRMTATRASIVQLGVPVIAAVGGIAFLGEHASLRLLVATVTILSGVALAVLSRRRAVGDESLTQGS